MPTTGVVATFGFLVALGFGVAARVLPREARAGVLVADGEGATEVALGDGLTVAGAAGRPGRLGGALGTALVTTGSLDGGRPGGEV